MLQQTIAAGKLSISRLAVCVSYELESASEKGTKSRDASEMRDSLACGVNAACARALYIFYAIEEANRARGKRQRARSGFKTKRSICVRFCFIAFCNFNDCGR
jgi:hypothetical protein